VSSHVVRNAIRRCLL